MLACWTQPQRQSLREGVDADTWLIAAYVANLGLWCWYGTRHLWRGARRRLGWGALAAVVVAGALDLLIENPALRTILDGDTAAAARATTAAVAKWTLLVLGAAYAAGALVAGLTRAWVVVGGPVVKAAFRQPSGFDHDTAPPPPPADLVVVPESETPDTFARRYRLPIAVEPGGVGISLSGGGIRSAAFALGCVQVYEQVPFPGDPDGRTIMGRADYLATVSGGGYLGGARQLLAHDLHERGEPGEALYGQQQPETHLLHGHHDYLWRNWQEAARGVPRIVAGVAVNMGLLAALVFLVARPLGWATFSTLLGQPGARSAPSGYWWGTALTFAILVVLGLAGGLWPHADRSERRSAARTLQLSLVGPGAIGLVLIIIGWRGPDFAQAWVPFAAALATGGVLFVAAKVAGPCRTARPLGQAPRHQPAGLGPHRLRLRSPGVLAGWRGGRPRRPPAVDRAGAAPRHRPRRHPGGRPRRLQHQAVEPVVAAPDDDHADEGHRGTGSDRRAAVGRGDGARPLGRRPVRRAAALGRRRHRDRAAVRVRRPEAVVAAPVLQAAARHRLLQHPHRAGHRPGAAVQHQDGHVVVGPAGARLTGAAAVLRRAHVEPRHRQPPAGLVVHVRPRLRRWSRRRLDAHHRPRSGPRSPEQWRRHAAGGHGHLRRRRGVVDGLVGQQRLERRHRRRQRPPRCLAAQSPLRAAASGNRRRGSWCRGCGGVASATSSRRSSAPSTSTTASST